MLVYLSDDLKSGISYRICRFPDLGASWVWCHIVRGGEMFAYTDQRLPCSVHKNQAEDSVAVYDVPGLEARIARSGSSAGLERVSFSIRVRCHAGTGPHEGLGNIPVSMDGIFYPDRAHDNVRPGRFERTGHIDAEI